MSATTDLLRELRAAGLSQTEIAARTGIAQPKLSRWENGSAPDSADDALKLLELHRVVCGASAAAASTPAP